MPLVGCQLRSTLDDPPMLYVVCSSMLHQEHR